MQLSRRDTQIGTRAESQNQSKHGTERTRQKEHEKKERTFGEKGMDALQSLVPHGQGT